MKRIMFYATLLAMASAGVQGDTWLCGDFHQHTKYTDGSDTFDFVMQQNDTYELDWWANSEHGGEYIRDGRGNLWDDPRYYAITTILGDYEMSGGHREMWRWQSLRDYVWLDIHHWRNRLPHKRIFSGLEWNVPGHEHASTVIVSDSAAALSAFEYMFDASDDDTCREGQQTDVGILTKRNGKRYQWLGGVKKPMGLSRSGAHQDAVAACAWMQQQYDQGIIENGWILWAHVERKGNWTSGGYNIEHFRNFNSAAPDICFGFEGIPGHQAAGNRGNYGDRAFGGTYGGAGYYIARVGGLWDALLGEGRRWYNYASSDYHRHVSQGGGDFYPGEYQKTWVYVMDENMNGEYCLNEIANALRSGNSWSVMGDLIDMLEFHIRQDQKTVGMGAELQAAAGDLEITIQFASPQRNHHGETPVVNHIDLIAGDITGVVYPKSPFYTKATNKTAHVLATFAAEDWHVNAEGLHTISTRIPISRSMYFRLRGTSHAPGTPLETDADGHPLRDTPGQDVWSDLWFYSNPIFVTIPSQQRPRRGG